MEQKARLTKLGVLVHVAGSRCNLGKCTVSFHAILHGVGFRRAARSPVSWVEVMNYGWVLLHKQTADVETVYLGACVCTPAFPAESPFLCEHGAAVVGP